MCQNIISIGQSLNWMLFDLTDTSDNVQPIQNRFGILNSRNCMYMLFYVSNSVWMDTNIISIVQSPNRMLLDPTNTQANVRPIQNNFWIIQNLNRMIMMHLYITQCTR